MKIEELKKVVEKATQAHAMPAVARLDNHDRALATFKYQVTPSVVGKLLRVAEMAKEYDRLGGAVILDLREALRDLEQS